MTETEIASIVKCIDMLGKMLPPPELYGTIVSRSSIGDALAKHSRVPKAYGPFVTIDKKL